MIGLILLGVVLYIGGVLLWGAFKVIELLWHLYVMHDLNEWENRKYEEERENARQNSQY